jgi:uncharacterized protein (DUF2141 family)
MAVGANGVGGLSLESGRLALFVFLMLSVLSFVASLIPTRKLSVGALTFAVFAAHLNWLPPRAQANETAVESVQNSVGDAKTDTKKGGRSAKKKIRDATGNGSMTEDVKDTAKNAGDDISNTASKVKRKAD